MSDHTEIDMHNHGEGGQDDFEAWGAELEGHISYEHDEVRTILESNNLLDGQTHHLASRDSLGPLDIVVTPFITPETITRNLFRVLFTQRFADRERLSLNGAVDCIIEPEPETIDLDTPPLANVWVMDEVAQRDQMGAVPEAHYDHPSQQAIIISNALHEARLEEMLGEPPSPDGRMAFLGRAVCIDRATYRHDTNDLALRLTAA